MLKAYFSAETAEHKEVVNHFCGLRKKKERAGWRERKRDKVLKIPQPTPIKS